MNCVPPFNELCVGFVVILDCEKEERASIKKGGEGVIEFCMMSFLAEELLLFVADPMKGNLDCSRM